MNFKTHFIFSTFAVNEQKSTSTGWPEEFSRSLSHRNYTFCSKKILLGTSRHSRALGFQPCTPIFYIYLCTVGHQNFQDQKFQIGLLATQKQIKTYWMTKPHQNNHKKFWLAGFFNTSKNLQNEWKNILRRVRKIWKSFFCRGNVMLVIGFEPFCCISFRLETSFM